MKKYLVLAILFILPIVAYLFFSSGVNHFAKLPLMTKDIHSLDAFESLDGDSLKLDDKITILLFFGDQVTAMKGNANHLKEKIFDKNQGFKDFQAIVIAKDGMQEEARELEEELAKTVKTDNWRFAFGTPEEQKALFNSLKTDLTLDGHQSSPYAFIIDKKRNLRGRDDDKDQEELYGYDTQSVSVLNNKMVDDVDVILAEYRLALKKYREHNKIHSK